MMIEREIPKEIKEYKTKYLFKMTLRQNIAFAVMLIINILLHVYAKRFLHSEIVDWLMLFVAVLTGAIALWKPNKQDFEKVAWFAIQTELIYPKKRVYKTENFFSNMRDEFIAEEKEKERKQAELEKYQARRERLKNNKFISRFKKELEEEVTEELADDLEEIQGELK